MPEELMTTLAAAANAVTAALEPAEQDSLLQAVVDAAREIFGAAACSLALVDEAAGSIVFRVASGSGAQEVLGKHIALGRGVAGWVVASGMPLAVDDVSADPRFGRDLAERTGYVPRSILAVPLQTDQAMLGVLSVLDRELPVGPVESQREMALLGLFASQAAYAIDSARVYKDVGSCLLQALRGAQPGDDLDAMLGRAQRAASAPDQRLLYLTSLFARLGRADTELLAIASKMLGDLVGYAETRLSV
ncbi:MAG TPA: GAF domain-containing protein [Mycobacteriales bacterium]|nr:GAF domain-containing protein [Mycobacteriales bacterium]